MQTVYVLLCYRDVDDDGLTWNPYIAGVYTDLEVAKQECDKEVSTALEGFHCAVIEVPLDTPIDEAEGFLCLLFWTRRDR